MEYSSMFLNIISTSPVAGNASHEKVTSLSSQ